MMMIIIIIGICLEIVYVRWLCTGDVDKSSGLCIDNNDIDYNNDDNYNNYDYNDNDGNDNSKKNLL